MAVCSATGDGVMFEAIDSATPLWFYGACGIVLLLISATEFQRGGR